MRDPRARIREAAGGELLERLDHLESLRATAPAHPAPPSAPESTDALDADVLVAGGGLWTLLAPLLARRGLRVVVLERARAGQAHREWNASGPELLALERAGLLTRAEIDALVVARYDHGTCRFAGGGDYPVSGVLDHAVDAQRLLDLARARAEAAGVVFLDGHTVLAHAGGASGVRLRARGPGGEVSLTGRLLVDARGASSPLATADLVCPTVGGVVAGLARGTGPDEVDPRVGDILATVDGIENGRQHVWEGFPGRPGETTVYLFYYAQAREPVSLVDLYARFFEKLPTYKRGDATLLRPTFGLIPGWSRLGPAPRPDHPRVVLVGDAAARHSPLTYCGFGATLRSLEGAAASIEQLASGAAASPGRIVDDAPIHALTGALACLLASRKLEGDTLNRLLDAAFATLHAEGDAAYGALLRDEMRPDDFVKFLRETAVRRRDVWGTVLRGLGPLNAGRWGLGVARSAWSARA